MFWFAFNKRAGQKCLGETVNKSVEEPARDICKALENKQKSLMNAAGLVVLSLEVSQVPVTERRWRGNSRKSAVI